MHGVPIQYSRKQSLNNLMDVIEYAGELEKRVDYEEVVNTKIAEEAMK